MKKILKTNSGTDSMTGQQSYGVSRIRTYDTAFSKREFYSWSAWIAKAWSGRDLFFWSRK